MSAEKMTIQTLFKSKQTALAEKLGTLLAHPVTKGDHCESAWIDFSRAFYQADMRLRKDLSLMQLEK